MIQGSIFVNNKTQAVRLPIEARFDDNIKRVVIRKVGKERILSPLENTWDSFFLNEEAVSDDFLTERAEQTESVREAF
ncbi:antitoxin [Methyloprofundus sedimenti]|uniref:Antitoxin n=1 Tax=Methyloprofundus sedimenti TaxID=1420851 RepID=A0A1V8M4I6_9GAMM|nr:type II toxin-antitoxin system VapB family antitoxin [Methyloprofundus sedimenti]OQK16472.1 antitoxin [Methyloprofundus sedimenti]